MPYLQCLLHIFGSLVTDEILCLKINSNIVRRCGLPLRKRNQNIYFISLKIRQELAPVETIYSNFAPFFLVFFLHRVFFADDLKCIEKNIVNRKRVNCVQTR